MGLLRNLAFVITLLCLSLGACQGEEEEKGLSLTTAPTPEAATCDDEHAEQCERDCVGGAFDACEVFARLRLGGLDGKGVDYVAARDALKMACDGGHLEACARLASVYGQGLGVAPDQEKMIHLATRACDGGELLGCTLLGAHGLIKRGFDADLGEAEKKLERACEQQEPNACGYLGMSLIRGFSAQRDPVKGRELLEKSCAANSGLGCFFLASMLSSGLDVERDEKKGALFFLRSCELGDASGCASTLEVMERLGWSETEQREHVKKMCRQRGIGCDLIDHAELDDEASALTQRALEAEQWSCDPRRTLAGCAHLIDRYFNGAGHTKTKDALAIRTAEQACEISPEQCLVLSEQAQRRAWPMPGELLDRYAERGCKGGAGCGALVDRAQMSVDDAPSQALEASCLTRPEACEALASRLEAVKDYDRALELRERACKQHPALCYPLVRRLEVKKDAARVADLIERSCHALQTPTLCSAHLKVAAESAASPSPGLGVIALNLCIDRQPEACGQAFDLVERSTLAASCEGGNRSRCRGAVWAYEAGLRRKKDAATLPEVVALWEAGCDQGVGEACALLVELYAPVDAPSPGSRVRAQDHLVRAFFRPLTPPGKTRDADSALSYAERGCSAGVGRACWQLAQLHERSETSRDSATPSMGLACRAGHARSCLLLLEADLPEAIGGCEGRGDRGACEQLARRIERYPVMHPLVGLHVDILKRACANKNPRGCRALAQRSSAEDGRRRWFLERMCRLSGAYCRDLSKFLLSEDNSTSKPDLINEFEALQRACLYDRGSCEQLEAWIKAGKISPERGNDHQLDRLVASLTPACWLKKNVHEPCAPLLAALEQRGDVAQAGAIYQLLCQYSSRHARDACEKLILSKSMNPQTLCAQGRALEQPCVRAIEAYERALSAPKNKAQVMDLTEKFEALLDYGCDQHHQKSCQTFGQRAQVRGDRARARAIFTKGCERVYEETKGERSRMRRRNPVLQSACVNLHNLCHFEDAEACAALAKVYESDADAKLDVDQIELLYRHACAGGWADARCDRLGRKKPSEGAPSPSAMKHLEALMESQGGDQRSTPKNITAP